ncbi:MAG: major capsid protein [Pyrinomonadaceae bacterium]
MSGIIYRFPTNVSMTQTTQEYAIEREKLLGLKIMPFEEHMTTQVEWDELDSERGMTSAHNMGTDPKIGRRPGSKTHRYEPIPFKETDIVGESELLRARQFGTLGGVIDLHETIGRIQKARVDKNFIRAEWCVWSALRGHLVVEENGVSVDETFNVQSYSVEDDWDEFASATPLADDQAVALKFRGTGASAKGARAYLNQTTLNWRLGNRNANDLAGLWPANLSSVLYDLEQMNKLQEKRGLPVYELYDEGYIDDYGDFQTYIEDGEVIVVGARPNGQKVGGVAMTPTLHNQKSGQPAPGFFSILEVNGRGNPGAVEVSSAELGAGKNPKVEITGGFYGGPRMPYPRSVIRMRVKLT